MSDCDLPLLPFEQSTPLPTLPDGWHALSYCITARGHLGILAIRFEILSRIGRRLQGGWAHFEVPDDLLGKFFEYDGQRLSAGPELRLRYWPYCYFDRLTDGSWVIAKTSAIAEEPNAQHILPNGEERRLKLGDDIRNFQADPKHGFWIGYGDIGCLTGGVHGVEGKCLVHYDRNGVPLKSYYDEGREGGYVTIDDVMCLNVSPHGVYAQTWAKFPIVKVEASRNRFVRTQSDYIDAFATDGQAYLLAGGYDAEERRLLVRYEPPPFKGSLRLSLSWRARLHRPRKLDEQLFVGRGDTLHSVDWKHWHRISIRFADAVLAEQQDGSGRV